MENATCVAELLSTSAVRVSPVRLVVAAMSASVVSIMGAATSSPVVSDGGASAAPVPQADGVAPSVKSSVPPAVRSVESMEVLVWGLPFTDSDCT